MIPPLPVYTASPQAYSKVLESGVRASTALVTSTPQRVSAPWAGTAAFSHGLVHHAGSADPWGTEEIDSAVISILKFSGIIKNEGQLLTLSDFVPNSGLTYWGMVAHKETGPDGQISLETLLIVAPGNTPARPYWTQVVANIKAWFDCYNMIMGRWHCQTKVDMIAAEVYYDTTSLQLTDGQSLT
ncbi:hypothetical protein PWT90_07427 [Aphanocladium album]|nr:hypothetical protein PWT90_07427 [Aphanocladium album]